MSLTRWPGSKKRLRRLLQVWLGLGLLGLLYAGCVNRLGVGIPCMFYCITGLQCPGCGVTRMLLCLFYLDFSGAWEQNPAVLCMLPFLLVLLVRVSFQYLKNGTKRLRRGEEYAVTAMVVMLLSFGIFRNFT